MSKNKSKFRRCKLIIIKGNKNMDEFKREKFPVITQKNPYHDLTTSTANLAAQIAKLKERNRIVTAINREQFDSGNSYITFDRLRKLLDEE